MAVPIKPLRRTGSSGQPNIANMEEGEIAVNAYDQKIWMRVGGNLIEIANASGAAWGGISGTLSNQTDLQNALNAKANDDAVVKTSGDQTNLSGDKTWTGTHTFTSTSLILSRDNNSHVLFQDTDGTRRGIVYSNVSDRSVRVRTYDTGGILASELILGDQFSWTGNGRFGSTNDSTTDTKLLTVSSNGYAGIFVNGDAGNSSGEPGGSFITLGIDGGEHSTGTTKTFISAINSSGGDGIGGTWSGTSANSGLLAIRGNYRLQLGSNGVVAMYVQGSHAVFNGNVTASGDIYSSGTVASGNALLRGVAEAAVFSFEGTTTGNTLYFRPRGTSSTINQTTIDWNGNMTVGGSVSDSSGDVRKVKRRLSNANTTIAASDMNGIIEKSNNTAYTYSMPSGMGTAGDILTLVNSGTAQAGTITVNGASGVVFRTGITSVSSFTIGPSEIVNLYRSNTNNRWIKS